MATEQLTTPRRSGDSDASLSGDGAWGLADAALRAVEADHSGNRIALARALHEVEVALVEIRDIPGQQPGVTGRVRLLHPTSDGVLSATVYLP